MSQANHRIVREFFEALPRGTVPESLLAPDMTFWSVNSGVSDKARFLGGVKLLAAVFGATMVYTVDALTAEEDRVAAEVRSHGTLNGEPFDNTHVFLFRIRDGRIAWIGEFMNQFVVRDRIAPALQAAMSASGR